MRRLSPNRGLQIGARTRRLDRARAAPAALGSISKQRDRYLRRLLIVGATTVICDDPDKHHEAACQKPVKKVAGALAKNLQGASARGVRITARKWEWPARQANCGGDDGVMGSSRAVDLENPGRFTCGRARRFDWDQISGSHQGQRLCAARTDPMRVGDVPTRLPVALEARRIFAMLQTLDVQVPIDYDRTLILAIELSSKNSVLAALA
jgi:hypothetical protein